MAVNMTPINTILRLAVSQSHTLSTTAETLEALTKTAFLASQQSIDLLLFPEAYLGGYPRGAAFGAAVGVRDDRGREQFLRYFKDSVDLGDTPAGDGEMWIRKERSDWAGNLHGDGKQEKIIRGDGTREKLEKVARETGVFLVVGLVERAGGTLYCAVVYLSGSGGKSCLYANLPMISYNPVVAEQNSLDLMILQTGTERLIWGQGQPSSLRAVTTNIRGVKLTLAAAICWENYMPLLRHSLYSQNVNLYLAPTADARDTWLSLMRTVACEGRCFVLSANQCVKKRDLPRWIYGENPEKVSSEREEIQKNPYRRKSVVTDLGNVIALPTDEKYDLERAVIDGDEIMNGKEHRRKSSIVTEHGHEIILPVVVEEVSMSKTVSGGVESMNGTEKAKPVSFVTEGGHEIILPTNCGRSKFERVANGHSPSKTGVTKSKAASSDFACRGGSCIISPTGDVLAGPLWEKENELLIVDMDFDDCLRGRLDLDVAGSYSRNDAFKLTVEGLDISPRA